MKKNFDRWRLLICLLCAAPMSLSAQAPDGEKLSKGFRIKTDEVVTIYADYMGQPNPFARYALDALFYFKLQGDSVVGCADSPFRGMEFTKIMIPGDAVNASNAKVLYQQVEQHLGIAGDVELPSCPDSFPVHSPSEVQVSSKQLGGVFWILTSDLVDNVEVVGKVNPSHVNLKKFDKSYTYSRFFSSALVVPFKYRFSIKNSSSTFTGESSLGAALGWTFARDYDFDNRAWLILSGGITSINPNTPFDDAGSEKEKNMPGATACLGIGVNVGEAQAGLVLGFDFADPSWEFHAKPWVAFSVGYAFLRPKGNPNN